jgi:predicted ArsR family transcriptional regulator
MKMQGIKKFASLTDCPIFSDYSERIDRLTRSIYDSKTIAKKVDNAREMLNIINILGNCPKYDEDRNDCLDCNFNLNLIREMARIIVEAAQTTC